MQSVTARSQLPGGTPVPTDPALGLRSRRAGSRALGVARILAGLVFIVSGLPKLIDQETWVASFERWDVPLAGLAVIAIGVLEVVGGVLLAFGVATRRFAAVFALTMAGAVVFAGTADGGQHLVLPPLLGALSALIGLRGGGAWQLRSADPR